MTLLRTRILPAVILAFVAGLAVFLLRPEPPATWLRVEAPTAVVVGEPFTATVTLLEPIGTTAHLDFDLHGRDAKKQPLRCVAAGPSQSVAAGVSTYTFTLVLRDRSDVATAHAVIYLSRTGRWGDAFRVARSESIPVFSGTPSPGASERRPWAVHDQKEDPAIEIPNPPIVRAAIAALWLLGAIVAGQRWRRSDRPRGAPVLAVILLTVVAWEATAAGAWFEAAGRALVRAAGAYEDRRHFQQGATLAVACVLGTVAAWGLRRNRRRIPSLTLVGLATYGGVELAAMLSLHEIDRLLAGSWGPISFAAGARAAAAVVALAGLARRPARTR